MVTSTQYQLQNLNTHTNQTVIPGIRERGRSGIIQTDTAMNLQLHQICVPERLTKRMPVGKIARWTHVETHVNDELAAWLEEHAPEHSVTRTLPNPLLTFIGDDTRALLKLTWGF